MEIRDYTTIEQSKKLLELGLSRDTANMVYLYWINSKTKEEGIEEIPTIGLPIENCDIPCWSLGALLRIMPDNFIELLKEGGMYRVKAEQKYVSCLSENPIDVVFEMVVNLLEKGYIEKEK